MQAEQGTTPPCHRAFVHAVLTFRTTPRNRNVMCVTNVIRNLLLPTLRKVKEAGEINFNNRFIETNICKIFQKKLNIQRFIIYFTFLTLKSVMYFMQTSHISQSSVDRGGRSLYFIGGNRPREVRGYDLGLAAGVRQPGLLRSAPGLVRQLFLFVS